jgi:hypothetical protein
VDFARRRIDNADPLARIVDERLCLRRHGAGASPASAAARTRARDRRTGCSRSRQGGPPGIPPTGSSSSRRAASARARVKRLMDLPMAWSDQWSALGLKDPAQATFSSAI